MDLEAVNEFMNCRVRATFTSGRVLEGSLTMTGRWDDGYRISVWGDGETDPEMIPVHALAKLEGDAEEGLVLLYGVSDNPSYEMEPEPDGFEASGTDEELEDAPDVEAETEDAALNGADHGLETLHSAAKRRKHRAKKE